MISIVIVNYNSENFLEKCLDSIQNSNLENIKIEVLIVNNSSKKYFQVIKNTNFSLKIIEVNKNIGFSKAANIGIKKSNFKTVLILNPDVLLFKNTLFKAFNYFKNKKNIGVLGCKVLNDNNSFQKSSRRRMPFLRVLFPYILKLHYLGLVNKYNYMDFSEDTIHCVDAISGAFMMFNKDIFYKIKGFDERFFLYFEDTDFCLKLNKSDFMVVYFPEAKIKHFKKGSRNLLNYISIEYNFYLSFLKFILKYRRIFFKFNN